MRSIVLFYFISLGTLFSQTTEMQINIESLLIDAEVDLVLGKTDMAIQHCKDVLEQDATNDVAAYMLAKIYDQENDFDLAKSFINSAISSNSENVWYHELLIDILKKQGFNKQAADAYDPLLKMDPHNKEYLLQKAYFLEKAKYNDEALEALDEYQKWHPLSENFVSQKVNLLTKMDKLDDAAQLASDYLEFHPDNKFMMSIYGSLLYNLGNEDKALEVYNKLASLDPYNVDAQKFLRATSHNTETPGDSYYTIAGDPSVDFDKKFPLFKPLLDKMEVGNREVIPTLDSLARILVQTHPDLPQANAFYADVLLFAGDDQKAQEYYKKTLELDNSNQDVWSNYLWYFFDTENYAALQKESSEALNYFPNNFSFLFLNGVGEIKMGNKEDGLDSFDILFSIAPDDNEFVQRGKSFLLMNGY